MNGNIVITQTETQVWVAMVKADNPNTTSILVTDNLFFRPIPGLIGLLQFKDTDKKFWCYSNEYGVMTITGTNANPLSSGMATLIMSDERVNSKAYEYYAVVG